MADPILLVAGRFQKQDGYGRIATTLFHALKEVGAPAAAFDVEASALVGEDHLLPLHENRGTTTTLEADPGTPMVVLVTERPDQLPSFRVEGRARFISQSLFELDKLPSAWTELISSVDEVWVPNEFNKRAYAMSGVPDFMISIVPYGVSTNLYRPVRSDVPIDRQTVRFTTVMSNFDRRDLGALLRSFLRSFGPSDPVELIVKLRAHEGHRTQAEGMLTTALELIGTKRPTALDRVRFVSADLTDRDMRYLLSETDVYVSIERASGWDYPSMEAMTMGKVVIGPNWGGRTAFANEDNSLLVTVGPAYEPMPSFSPSRFAPHYRGHRWPELGEYEYDNALRKAFELGRTGRSELGRRAREHIVTQFDARKVANDVMDRIRKYNDSDYRGSGVATLSHRKSGLWNRENPPTPEQLAEIRIRGALAKMQTAPLWRLVAKAKAYKDASRVRGQVGKLAPTPWIEALESSRKVSKLKPLQKINSIRHLSKAISKLDRESRNKAIRVGDAADLLTNQLLGVTTPTVAESDAVSVVEARRELLKELRGFPAPEDHLEALAKLKDIYEGERIFIIGNGPSINRQPLELLADEYTFGVNKIYLLFDRVSWRPSFFTMMDWHVGPEVAPHMPELKESLKLLPYRFYGIVPPADDIVWYSSAAIGDYMTDQFRADIREGVPSRGTVLVTAIQLAFHMGFREQYLIGADAEYQIPASVVQSGPDLFGAGEKLHLTSTADDDPNHFDPRLFGAGAKWHDPNVDEMKRSFRRVRKGVERAGGSIMNASLGGSLEVFQRVDFKDLF